MSTGMACQHCGVPVSAGARFCMNCGADVSSEQGNVATRKFTSTQAMHDQLLARLRHAALGDHEILTELGRGGMATVYLAHDIQLDRKVAIKVMLPALLEGDDMVERFRLEARTAAQLSHPHIIPIFNVRASEGLVYFVMKFVEGRPLDAILKELGQLPVPMVRSILSRVGEALGYAHRRGVVHRDIKPANLMIDIEGQPVVTDFGIAKVADARGLTMTGAMMGTPTYMSPEQCSGGEITGASDQYSLGIVAYQMLGGRVPFEGETLVGLLYKHINEVPRPLLQVRSDCPAPLAAAVMRMLEKDPAHRFPTMEAAVEAIGAVTLAYDDPIRTQLVGLAKLGANVEMLKRVSTPSSPIPMRKPSVARRATAPVQDAATTPVNTGTPPANSVRKQPVLAYAGGAALVAVVALLLWTKPWASGADSLTSGAASLPPAPQAAQAPATRPQDSTPATSPGTTANVPPAAPTPGPTDGAPAAAVASIRIDAPRTSMTVGETMTLRAGALSARGGALADRPTFRSLNPARASVSSSGELTALQPGPVTVVASVGNVSQRLEVQVEPLRAASVTLAALPGSIEVGETARLNARVVGPNGETMASEVTWRSESPNVAVVDGGVVRAVGPGRADITASADGREARVTVQVVAREVASPPSSPAPRPEPPAVEPRVAIEATVQQFARGLQAKDLVKLRELYPAMTTAWENRFNQVLATLPEPTVTLTVGVLRITGDQATGVVTTRYEFFSRENRRRESVTSQEQYTFARGPSGWLIRSIEDIK